MVTLDNCRFHVKQLVIHDKLVMRISHLYKTAAPHYYQYAPDVNKLAEVCWA